MTDRSGGCLCGAVRFTATDVPEEIGACHCEMCRRWTGSALIAATTPGAGIRWTGTESIRVRQTSDWAERAWCDACGSALYYHVTAPGPHRDNYELPIGLFDDPAGFSLTSEIYIDHKPDCFAFAGSGRQTLTRQQCLEKFGDLASQ